MNNVTNFLQFQPIYINKDNTTAYIILNTDNAQELYKIFTGNQDCKGLNSIIRRSSLTGIDVAIVFNIIKIGNSTYMYIKYIYDSTTYKYGPSECTDNERFVGDLIDENVIFLYSFSPNENIIKINTRIHPELADNKDKNKPLNNERASENTIPKKVTVSKLSKIRTGDTDYEDIINKLYKIVGELSCRETSGNCNSSNSWSDLCNAGIKLFNKLK
ncbi:MAG TPA: hypothetical protein PLC53_02375 [Bacilli bacterium]|nr:hypothetical protein [Bacilli bacterium]